jgi:hypothetical protein
VHAVVAYPSDPHLVGTDVTLSGVSDADIAAAKNFFLKFSNEVVLDETNYGHILQTKAGRKSRIFKSRKKQRFQYVRCRACPAQPQSFRGNPHSVPAELPVRLAIW